MVNGHLETSGIGFDRQKPIEATKPFASLSAEKQVVAAQRERW
jgi:hypothetical protein